MVKTKKTWQRTLKFLFLIILLCVGVKVSTYKVLAYETNGYAREQLTDIEKSIYDSLKESIIQVANGELKSTQFSVIPEVEYTASDLGMNSIMNGGTLSVTALVKAISKFNTEVDIDKIVYALMHDCPYELYWFDKAAWYKSNGISPGAGSTSDKVKIREISLLFPVATPYQNGDQYLINTDVAKATAEMITEKASAIVEQYSDLTDEEKLKAYRDEICAMVTYDHAAMDGNVDANYSVDSNPWSLVYVFDDNTGTNVVCEGYSKAFKYLCDLTDFEYDNIKCYGVNGNNHMWNIVTMGDGNNYLVDLTNSDEGAIGVNGELFLAGKEGTIAEGYIFDIETAAGDTKSVEYTYYDTTTNLWGADTGILALAEEDYGPKDNLAFYGASLTLYDNLSVKFKVDKTRFDANYQEPYVVFIFNGAETIVKEYVVDGDKYVFEFSNIPPHRIGDIISATLYADYYGMEYESKTIEYSVATYCYNMLNKYGEAGEEKAELRTMLVDLLNYGAATQLYTGYKTDDLINASLTGTQAAWGTQETPDLVSVLNTAYEKIDNPSVAWKGASLRLEESVAVKYKIAAESIDGLKVVFRIDSGKQWTISSDNFEKTDGGYYIYFRGLNAAQMSENIYATVYDEAGNAVSNTVLYSIESYVSSKQNSTNEKLVNMIIAMIKYGKAAYNYVY